MVAPFGIELFSSLSDVEVLSDVGQGKYFVNPPSPHPLFREYVVQATSELGVVWVKALGEVIESDNFGNATRAATDRIFDQLKVKYGEAQRQDFLMSGSIWSDPQDWMSALNNNERFYSMIWEKGRAKSLPEQIETIFLGASAYGGHASRIVLEYASVKIKQAEGELEREMSNLL